MRLKDARIAREIAGLNVVIKACEDPMPPGFKWNYQHYYNRRFCTGCAVGLLFYLGKLPEPSPHAAMRVFGLDEITVIRVFTGAHFENDIIARKLVRPHHVAATARKLIQELEAA